jgi:membrane fusion protein, heavy metal efflux system
MTIQNKYSAISILLFFAFTISGCAGDKTAPEVKVEEKSISKSIEQEEVSGNMAELSQAQIDAIGLQYTAVEMKDLTATIKANGNLIVENNNKANATSLYGGVIKNLNIHIGSHVGKGQVIATISNPQFIQLQEEYLTLKSISGSASNATTASNGSYASLSLQKNEVVHQLENAQKELSRQNELFAANATARKNVELAQSAVNALQARLSTIAEQQKIYVSHGGTTNSTRLASVRKQLEMMGINVNSISNNNLQSSLAVRSPISGTVSTVMAKIGSYVDVSAPVAEIVNNGSVHLHLNVFEKDLPMLRVGQTIHFTLTNNPINEYDAKVHSIGTAFETDTKTIPVHCEVEGSTSGLIDGMNVSAIVSLSNSTSAAVPNDAIISYEGKDYIFALKNVGKEGSTYERIQVLRGTSNVGHTAITAVTPLPDNAKIVSKGAFFINAKMTNVEEE